MPSAQPGESGLAYWLKISSTLLISVGVSDWAELRPHRSRIEKTASVSRCMAEDYMRTDVSRSGELSRFRNGCGSRSIPDYCHSDRSQESLPQQSGQGREVSTPPEFRSLHSGSAQHD